MAEEPGEAQEHLAWSPSATGGADATPPAGHRKTDLTDRYVTRVDVTEGIPVLGEQNGALPGPLTPLP